MKKLSTEPYKGTRDFYPEDMAVQNYLFSNMRKVVESYGYVEYSAPLMEETDLYKAKSGEELVNEQTYTFTDRGGRDITIRPEMTPTLARMVARKRQELTFPLRWYSIVNLFRYERPQRGRLREHWQLNFDVFGLDSLQADLEIIEIAYKLLKTFGASDKDFIIKVNNRKLVSYFFTNCLELDENSAYKISKLLDKKNKIGEEVFASQAKDLIGKEKIVGLIDYAQTRTIKQAAEKFNCPGLSELEEVFRLAGDRGITNLVYDPTLMRGLDYYTGTVFEVFDTNPANSRSLFGGGRYDDLVGLFGVEKVTGVGFGMGDVTIKDFLETHNLISECKVSTDIYLCVLGKNLFEYASEVASALRKNGLNVSVDYSERKIGLQVKTADRQKIPYVICIGESEAQTRNLTLKELATGKEKTGKIEEIISHLKS